MNDSAEWPSCPKCGKRSMVIGGGLAACANCSFLEQESKVRPNDLKTFALSKMASRTNSTRGIIQFVDHKPSEEEGNRIGCVASELAGYLIHAPYLHQACRHLSAHGKFIPVALMEDHPEHSLPEVLPLTDHRSVVRLGERSMRKDVVSTIWLKSGEYSSTKGWGDTPDPEGDHLVMETHIYNRPTICTIIPVEIYGNEVVMEWGERQILKRPNIPSLIYQPIYWNIIHCVPGRIQQRYLGVVEIKDDINFTFSVYEDLDGPVNLEIAIRTPWMTTPAEIRTCPVASAEEGIEMAAAKFKLVTEAAREKGGTVLLEQQVQFKQDMHPLNAMDFIRRMKFWVDYAPIRTRH